MEINPLLIESSLSRVWQFVEDPNRGFVMISPAREYLSDSENKERYEQLKKDVRALGYGYIETRGGYEEKGAGIVTEPSLLVPEMSRKDAIALGEKYDQDSILYKDGREFIEIGTNSDTGVGKVLGRFKMGAGHDNITLSSPLLKKFFTSLVKGSHRGRKFLFNMEEREPESLRRAIREELGLSGPRQWKKIAVVEVTP